MELGNGVNRVFINIKALFDLGVAGIKIDSYKRSLKGAPYDLGKKDPYLPRGITSKGINLMLEFVLCATVYLLISKHLYNFVYFSYQCSDLILLIRWS